SFTMYPLCVLCVSSLLDMINQFFDIPNDTPRSSPPAPDVGPLSKWLISLVQLHHPTSASSSSDPSLSPELQKTLSLFPLLRSRRHLSTRGTPHHHAQLMRVGCKLGTCQVQNLSHRLYQLIGQRGREDSSPINPKSPHSYG
uniref:Adrenomedullin 2b n=1 Tax=Periophthalmus magnuspinnatus TaxID=409849 RepID=A0A3B3ZB76_9GOBI